MPLCATSSRPILRGARSAIRFASRSRSMNGRKASMGKIANRSRSTAFCCARRMLVSGWAKRATFLWAVLPPLALSLVEGIAFRTGHIANILLKDRLFGMADKAFNLITPDGTPVDAHFIPLSQFTPLRFLSSPGLWLGLIFAGLCFFAAIRLRRYREPI